MSKHIDRDWDFPKDDERNPDIGKSKGAFATGESPHKIDGKSTFVGDIQNDSGPGGGVRPDDVGRTNK